ncbi:MAG: hypothetical protein FWD57_12735 [Polyangiaceae bacterium]|nr:hypothetical protein [Polyangiaceae bacterium]
MSILVPADHCDELRQGDLLVQAITPSINEDGRYACNTGIVLVVSRNCNAFRKPYITVASVETRPITGVQHAKTIGALVEYFKQLRDGESMLDTFYLGTINADTQNRYVAKLDQLHTISIPKHLDARQEYLRAHRTHHLSQDYVRELQLRLFRAFASMGFDDYEWWDDGDLDFVKRVGLAQLSVAKAELSRLEAERDGKVLACGQQHARGYDSDIAKLKNRLANIESEISPVLRAQEKRQHPANTRPLSTENSCEQLLTKK